MFGIAAPRFRPGGGHVSPKLSLDFCGSSCYDARMSTTTVTSTQLENALSNAGVEIDFSAVRIDYSGRGMMGDRCVGIVGSPQECTLFAVALAAEIIIDAQGESTNSVSAAVSDVLRQVAAMNPAVDSMGLDQIMYWPSVEFGADDGEWNWDDED